MISQRKLGLLYKYKFLVGVRIHNVIFGGFISLTMVNRKVNNTE
jgi:hypothetical protein